VARDLGILRTTISRGEWISVSTSSVWHYRGVDDASGRSPNVAAATSDRTIFISYARDDDEAFVTRLRENLIANGKAVWWDRASMESRGRTFLAEIRAAIESAERLVLVVGTKTKERPYVEVEWRHALRNGVVVTPILRLGDYSDVPEALTALHCEDVREHVPEAQAMAEVRRILDKPVPPLGPLLGVPRLPSPYVARPDTLDRLLSRVLIDSYQPIDMEADQRITALTGMGGVGKSVLATALAQTAEVRRSFQGGVVWTTVGKNPDLLRILTRIGRAVGDDVSNYSDLDAVRILLGRALAQANYLLILDDVWDPEVVDALHLAAGKGVRILMTSRHQDLFASTGVHHIVVDELSERQGLELLAQWTSTPLEQLPKEAREICAECGNLPLALSMIGAMIGSRPDHWAYALERMRRADLAKVSARIPDYPYQTLDRAMLVSFEELDSPFQERYLDLAALPEDASAPIQMFQRWWVAEGADSLDAVETMDRLVERSLVRVYSDGRCAVHDVQRDFLLARVGDSASLHSRWLAAFRPGEGAGWWTAPDDGYLLDHLDYHLREAGRVDEWRELLTSFEWLESKAVRRGFPAVLQDLLREVDQGAIGVLERACRRAAHVLTNDPSQLAAQLLARLDPHSGEPAIDRLRVAARSHDQPGWLCPVNASLTSDGDPMSVAFRGRERDGHAGTPRSIAVSSGASLIASGGGSSNDLTVKLWSVPGAALLWTLQDVMAGGGQAPLAFVAHDGRLAVAGGDQVTVHSPTSEDLVATARFAGRSVADVCRGHEEGVAIVAFNDGGIIVWNLADDSVVTVREPDGDAIVALSHAQAAPRLFAATATHVECRNTDDGRLVDEIEASINGWERPAFFTANQDGSRLWFDNPACAWSIATGTTSPFMEGAGRIVAITPDGHTALAIPDDGSYDHQDLVILDVETATPRGRIRNGRQISCLALPDEAHVVVTADYEHDVKLWDLARATIDLADWEARGRVARSTICDDGGLAMVLAANAVEVWDTETGRVVGSPDAEQSTRLVRNGSPLDGPVLDADLRTRMEAIVEGAKQRDDLWHSGVGTAALSRTSRRAVTAPPLPGKGPDREEPIELGPGQQPGRLWIWDLDDLHAARRVSGATGWITSLSMTGDGRYALTGSQGRILRLWDLDAGTCVQSLRGHRGIVYSCGVSDDAHYAVSGSEDMTVRLWDLQAGLLLFTFATASAVDSCDISSDGRVAIAGEVSGRVHVFDVRR
jgi:WD40 repeat protein